MFKRLCVQIPAPATGWTFFTLYCNKNYHVCLKKINKNEAEDGPFLKSCISFRGPIEKLVYFGASLHLAVL